MKLNQILVALVIISCITMFNRVYCGDMAEIAISIDTEIDVRSSIDSNADDVLMKFRKSDSFNEVSMQQLIDLLTIEVDLVEYLIAGNRGQIIIDCINARMSYLEQVIPSVEYVYNSILNAVTESNELSASRCALPHAQKREFLYGVAARLEDYYKKLATLHYESSIAVTHKEDKFSPVPKKKQS